MTHAIITIDGHTVSITGPDAAMMAARLVATEPDDETCWSPVLLVVILTIVCSAGVLWISQGFLPWVMSMAEAGRFVP